jgi:hypothetical protein
MAFRASHIASATKMHGKIDARIFRNITMAAIFALIFSGFSFDFEAKANAYNNQNKPKQN